MDKTLKFTDSHEWVRDNGDGTVTLGISEHAQEMLGDVVFVDLPDVEDEVEAGESFSLVESVKAASDIYSPVTGEIVEINEELEDSPELINEEPYYEGGWIVKVKLSNPSELDDLKDAEEYLNSIEEE
ncbi:TPA: glycine cleavage system protein GcvH [Vibrio diabolicus]